MHNFVETDYGKLPSIKTKNMNFKKLIINVSFLAGLILGFNPIILAQFIQQGPKLVGTGSVGSPQQGYSVSISSDGNTAIVGGYTDNINAGAIWLYTRSGGVWTQQGTKLVSADAVGTAKQGISVSISSDGNTAIAGGDFDNTNAGAAWIYTRSGSTWTEDQKVVGTGITGSIAARQGISVSLSSDGNTAIVGGYLDGNGIGAAWIYTRSGTVWTQQGAKLVGTGAIGNALQGSAVSLSSDGNTAIVGGTGDNSNVGAVWIFTRSGTIWSQQTKLVGTGAVGNALQGSSVSLSSDGNTAIVGGPNDNTNLGAAWVFTRSGTVWTQQTELADASGASAQQGMSVSISSDGNTALVGGSGDNSNAGAAWLYTRSAGVWTQLGSKLVGTGAADPAKQGSSVSISSDGSTAIVGGYNDNSGAGAAWVYFNSAVLPVNFISISANRNNMGTVLVNWKVADEEGILRYEVERSADGRSFAVVGSVAGNAGPSYNWLDILPLPGVAFYRVKSVDISEKIKYTGTVKVQTGNESSMFIISPNPKTGRQLNIQFINQIKGLYDIHLIDADGRLLFMTNVQHSGGNSTQTINFPSNISHGISHLLIIAPNKTITAKQIIY
jgi:hypothetical protein